MMSTTQQRVEALHLQAMEIYERALLLRREGLQEQFQAEALEALALEREAAQLYDSEPAPAEPGRTILFKSAAAIAALVRQHQDVINLAGAGLARCADGALRQELMSMLKQANFELELYQRDGVKLSDVHLEMSIDGEAVGDGFAREDTFRKYIGNLITMVRRTWQRHDGVAFNDKNTRGEFPLYVALAPGSMAVRMHLGEMVAPELAGIRHQANPEAVVEDVIHGLELMQEGNLEALSDVIADDVYRSNFLEIGRNLLPDKDAVSVVKVFANTRRRERVVLTRHIDKLAKPRKRQKREPRTVLIEGELLLANSLAMGREVVGIVTGEGKEYHIRVPEHMMDDIVRPLWHRRVRATVNVRPKGRGEFREMVHCDPID